MNDAHLTLHGLAIKKHAAADSIAGAVGLACERVAELLEDAAGSGRAVKAEGRYLLSPVGRMILDGQYSRLYAGIRADPDVVAAYERFERINKDLKQLVTDWQTIELAGGRVRNDHADKAYDARIIERLGDLHERFEPILNELRLRLERFGIYRRKLEHALAQAEDGKREWVSDAKLDSYHTVWFEMHEDLLRILGRMRDE